MTQFEQKQYRKDVSDIELANICAVAFSFILMLWNQLMQPH